MTFIRDDGTLVPDSDPTHQCGCMTLSAEQQAALLKAVVPGASWKTCGARSAMQYSDFMKLCSTFMEADSDFDDRPWLTTAIKATTLASQLEVVLSKCSMTAKPWNAFMMELEACWQTMSDAERPPTVKVSNCITVTMVAETHAQAIPAWMQLITWGALRRSASGLRGMGWLEQAACKRFNSSPLNKSSPGCKVLELLNEVAEKLDISNAHTEDDDRAYNVITILNNVVLDPSQEKYVLPGAERWSTARDEARNAGDGRNGQSFLAQDRLALVIRAVADTVHLVTKGCRTLQARLSVVQQLGNSYLPAHVADPNILFTPDGIRELERRVQKKKPLLELVQADSNAGVQALLATLLDNSVEERSLLLSGGNAGDIGGGSGQGQEAAHGGYSFSARLSAAKLESDNAAILADLGTLLLDAATAADGMAVLQLLFHGCTTAAPNRKPSGLTHQMAWGKLPGHWVDPQFAHITSISKNQMGAYLVKAVTAKVTNMKLADKSAFSSLNLDRLAESLRQDEWAKKAGEQQDQWEHFVDFYNDLLIPVYRCIHAGDSERLQRYKSVPKDKVYLDPLLNQKLPKLVGAVFEAIGRPHDGSGTLRGEISACTDWVDFHSGTSLHRTMAIAKGQRALILGLLNEASTWGAPARDARNPQAKLTVAFLGGSADAGARNKWAELQERVRKSEVRSQERNIDEGVDGTDATESVLHSAPGIAAYSELFGSGSDGKGGGGHKREREVWQEWQPPGKGQEWPSWSSPSNNPSWQDGNISWAENGDILIATAGPSGKQCSIRYDAKRARSDLTNMGHDAQKVCIPWLLCNGLGLKDGGCPKPGDPEHAAGADGAFPPAHPRCGFRAAFYRLDPKPSSRFVGGEGGRAGGKGGGRGDGKGGGKGDGKGGKGGHKGGKKGGKPDKGGKGAGKARGRGSAWGGRGSMSRGNHNPNLVGDHPLAEKEAVTLPLSQPRSQVGSRARSMLLAFSMLPVLPLIPVHSRLEHLLAARASAATESERACMRCEKGLMRDRPGCVCGSGDCNTCGFLGCTCTCTSSNQGHLIFSAGDERQRALGHIALPLHDPFAPTILLVCNHSEALPAAMEAAFPSEIVLTCDYRQADRAGRLHYPGDFKDILWHRRWKLIFGNPPCHPTSKSNTTGLYERYMDGSHWGAHITILLLWCAPADRVILEQPPSDISDSWRQPDQVVQHQRCGLPYSKEWQLYHRGDDIPTFATGDITPRAGIAPHRERMHDRTERERVHSLTPPAVAQLICTQLADALDMHLPVGQTASTQPIFQIEVERLAERYQRIHPLPAHYADPWAAGRAPEAWLRAEQDTMDTLVAPGAGDVPWHNAPRTHTVL